MGQGFAYALRPLFVHPKRPSAAELGNLALQLVFNALILHFWGAKALAYLPISSLIVMGLHPVAGHYISEHYVFRAGQETYSYYGPLNRLTFNVGYHNEHHDFPYIAGSRLAELRAIAPRILRLTVKPQLLDPDAVAVHQPPPTSAAIAG